MYRKQMLLVVFIALFSIVFFATKAHSQINERELITVNSDGIASNNASFTPAPSYDGRFIAFMSFENSWFPENDVIEGCLPAPNCIDVFMRDRETQETRKLTIGIDHKTGNDHSGEPSISADGKLVAFHSYASNLVPNDTNNINEFTLDGMDVFLYHWDSGHRERVSLSSTGKELIGNSYMPILSGDGKTLYFASEARHVVPDVNPSGACPELTPCNLVYRLDLATRQIELVFWGADGLAPNDRTEIRHTTYDGRYLVFFSYATNLTGLSNNGVEHHTYIYDHVTGQVTMVSKNAAGVAGNANSGQVQISPDGSYVVFKSDASNLVSNDTNNHADVFLYEVATGNITRLSVGSMGEQANNRSKDTSICAGGRFVSFTSFANNLTAGDANGTADAFFYDVYHKQMRAISMASDGSMGNHETHKSVLSPNCQGVAFATDASNLVANDHNGTRDIIWGDLVKPADFSQSNIGSNIVTTISDTVTMTVQIVNSGHEAGSAIFRHPLPSTLHYETSLTGGVTYNAGMNQLEWSGTVPAQSVITLQYVLSIDAGITTDFTTISHQATITGDGATTTLPHMLTLNASYTIFLPATPNEGAFDFINW